MTFSISLKTLLVCCFSIFGFQCLLSQTELNRNYKFKDGIYMSAEDFRNDSPTIPPDEYSFEEKSSSSGFYQRKLYHFKIVDDKKYLSERKVNKIWGICIDGIPYINQQQIIRNVHQEEFVNVVKKNDFHVFTRIIMIGSICTITAEAYKNAYRPVRGPASGAPSLRDKKYVTDRKLLKLKDGELVNFNANNLLEMIADDPELYKDFKKDKKKKKRIDEYVLMYNSRNPIYVE